MFNVGVVGAGYVGLVTGACLAHIGHRVVCVDKDKDRIAGLERGLLPFYESGLAEMVKENVHRGWLRFSSNLSEAAHEADVLFIAVDTPQDEDGSANLSSVAVVARSIGRALSGAKRECPLVVANKSTVPVGSGDYVSMLIREGAEESGSHDDLNYRVASNPEFLRE